MRNDPTKAIFDYEVSSAERFKHVNNDMFMNGSQDSDSHSPFMVYIRSKSPQEYRTTTSSGDIRSSGRTMATRPGMIMETMAVNLTAAVGGTADHLMKQPPLALIRLTRKTHTFSTTNFNQINPHRQQDYTVRDQ